jgi:hypothetical protein
MKPGTLSGIKNRPGKKERRALRSSLEKDYKRIHGTKSIFIA